MHTEGSAESLNQNVSPLQVCRLGTPCVQNLWKGPCKWRCWRLRIRKGSLGQLPSKEKDSAYAFTVNNVAATQGHLLAAGARLRGAQNCKNNCPVCRMEHYQPSELCKEHMAHTADRIRDYEVRSLMRSQDLGCGLHPDRLPCKVCHAHHIMFTPHDNPRSHQLPGSCRVCGSYHSPEYMLDRACRTAGMDSVSRLQTLASSTGVPRMDGSTYSMPHGPLSGSRGGMMNKSGAFNSNMSLSLGVSTAPGTRRFSIV